MDFKEIIDKIFVNKQLYVDISDDDKINSFFIINRKFGKQYPDKAKIFNHKNIDKSSAVDMWFDFFKDIHHIPKWYWDTKRIKKIDEKKREIDCSLIKNRYEFNDNDINYLKLHFPEELKKELSKLKKFDNSQV